MLRYAILGSIELRDGETRLSVGGARQVALLAFLLVNANRGVSNDLLIDALWDAERSAGAVKRLQMAIARLRRTLDPLTGANSPLQTTSNGYLLAVAPGELDSDMFESRSAQGLVTSWRRRSSSGAAPSHSPTSRTRRSRRARSGVWKSSGSLPSRRGSKPISVSGIMRRSSVSWRR
jgi:DNA-binding SARP family transcriptional activator